MKALFESARNVVMVLALYGMLARIRPFIEIMGAMIVATFALGILEGAIAEWREKRREAGVMFGRILSYIFAIVIGKKVATSPSIHPADPDSRFYSPEVFANHGTSDAHRPANQTTDDDANGGRD